MNKQMYRRRNNYLRFGTNHIFINFTDDNLIDMAAISVYYGRKARTKKIKKPRTVCNNEGGVHVELQPVDIPIWSGQIHIFIDYVDVTTRNRSSTFELLKEVKIKFGSIFKIIVHFYSPAAVSSMHTINRHICDDQLRTKWYIEYRNGLKDLIDEPNGKITIFAHHAYTPISFEEGFTRVTVQMGEEGMEVVTRIMVNTRDTNVRSYEPYRTKPPCSKRRK